VAGEESAEALSEEGRGELSEMMPAPAHRRQTVSDVPDEAVTMAYAEYQRLYPQRTAPWGELAEWERERFRRVIGSAAAVLLAAAQERIAGMAGALNNAAAIIGERDRQLAEARAQERERIARHLDALAANYPEDVFPPGADSRDGISGAAMRHAYRNAARSVLEDLSEGDGNG
jgi:hypothetical protein